MSNVVKYKGFYSKVEYSTEDGILHGRIEGICDLVTFECESVSEIEAAFQEAVDDYLSFCEEVGKIPETPDPMEGKVKQHNSFCQ